ncbi:hypothetical protein FQA39_LY14371 [Lamprigera yunnana]|nr:hypothetical protein FQA39_LY14371 [Lamprigera yunnana]
MLCVGKLNSIANNNNALNLARGVCEVPKRSERKSTIFPLYVPVVSTCAHSNCIEEVTDVKFKWFLPINMNSEKLKKMQAQVRIGGKGTPRRKKKVVHSTQATDDKKLQSSLKKLAVNTIPGIEEVNMIKDDGTVIHFNNPKAQASLAANTFAITGHGESKQITEMLPGILSQLGPEGLNQLKRLASTVANAGVGKIVPEDEEDVPDLVENFDEASKAEVGKKKEDGKSKDKDKKDN